MNINTQFKNKIVNKFQTNHFNHKIVLDKKKTYLYLNRLIIKKIYKEITKINKKAKFLNLNSSQNINLKFKNRFLIKSMSGTGRIELFFKKNLLILIYFQNIFY